VTAIVRLPPDGVCVPTGATFVGAGRADRSTAFVSVINQVNAATGNRNAMSYSASGGGTSTVVVPLAVKGYNNWLGRNGWNTGLSVQNLGSATATATVYVYNLSGTQVATAPLTIAPYNTAVVYPLPVGDGFIGSAAVSANQPIAVVVNHATPTYGSDDTSMSYTGLNR
jgi:hypothetical protein